MGAEDATEAKNIQSEERLSTALYERLLALKAEIGQLRKESEHLVKTGKRLKRIIRRKENENESEIRGEQEMRQNLARESVSTIQRKAGKLREEDQRESVLSKEEALVLQGMLNELHETYKHGEGIVSAGQDLYKLIKELYAADIEDYQLEVGGSKDTQGA